MSSFILNIVGCGIIEVLASVLLPDGKMKKFTLSIIALFLFYCVVYPLCNFVANGELDEIISNLF